MDVDGLPTSSCTDGSRISKYMSIFKVLVRTLYGEAGKDGSEGAHFDQLRFYIRLFNFEPILPLKHLKASQYGES